MGSNKLFNYVTFQLCNSNPIEIILTQNINKTKCGVLLKGQEIDYGHFEKSRKFVLVYYQILLIASAVTI